MKKIITALICFTLAGCASMGMPGSISETISGFDNTKEIHLEPAWIYDGALGSNSSIKLGLYKTSKMDADKAIMVVVVRGTYNFDDKEPLQFNIDGQFNSFESMDLLTDIETKDGGEYLGYYNESSKRFSVTKDFIKRLLDAKEVWVKVKLSKEYVEGKFSKDAPSLARPAFRKFYDKVWETKETKEIKQ